MLDWDCTLFISFSMVLLFTICICLLAIFYQGDKKQVAKEISKTRQISELDKKNNIEVGKRYGQDSAQEFPSDNSP